MTKQEAEEYDIFFKGNNIPENQISLVKVKVLLKKIYDDLESRKCKTCKHYYKIPASGGSMKCQLHGIHLGKDFGCIDHDRTTDSK